MNVTDKLRSLVETDGYTLALSDGAEIITDSRRGIRPLMELLDGGKNVRGWQAADKIVGRAAAALYIRLGVAGVYASVITKDALAALRDNCITVGYGALTERIINRQGTGMCPMEEAIHGVTDTDECIQALRAKLDELPMNG